jgi:phospholipase/carboxylesterase
MVTPSAHRPERDPHRGQPILTAGAPLSPQVPGAVVMVHGRGATAESILELAAEFRRPDLACLAPQAAGFAWYPSSFLAPIPQNEPWLTSALALLGEVVDHLEKEGVPPERTVLLGFSQGACLALEFAARNAHRFPRGLGGVVGLSGGLIGPPGTPRDYPGGPQTFAGTPVFLGCSDRDPHIPKPRVDETAEVLGEMGADVTERIYPGLGHTVNEEELDHVRALLGRLGRG